MAGPPGCPVLRYTAAAGAPEPRERPWTVSLDAFERQLELIAAAGGISLTASSLAAGLRAGAAPPKALVLSFDGTKADTATMVLLAADRGLRSTVYVATGRLDRPGMLSRDDLVALLDAGAEIGAAGHTYRGLDEISPDDQQGEIIRCRDDLAAVLGRPPSSFAYPHGRHDPSARAAVAGAGFAYAFAAAEALARPGEDLLAIPRLTVRHDTPDDVLLAWLEGRDGRTAAKPPVGVAGSLRAAAARLARRARGLPSRGAIPAQETPASPVPTKSGKAASGTTPPPPWPPGARWESAEWGSAGRAARPVTNLHLPDPVPAQSSPRDDHAGDGGTGAGPAPGGLPVRVPRASGHGPGRHHRG